MSCMPKHLFETVARVLHEGGLSKRALRRIVAGFPNPAAEERALRAESEYLAHFCPWYTARELAGMPGMPARAAEVRKLLDAKGAASRRRFGCRRQLEYPSSSLPPLTLRFMPPGRQVTPQAKADAVRSYEYALSCLARRRSGNLRGIAYEAWLVCGR